MWFERARFGHLDDEAFDALSNAHHDPANQTNSDETSSKIPQHPTDDKSAKQKKASPKSALKISDFTHAGLSRKPSSPKPVCKPITEPTDGRWVLAVRTAESLKQGQLAPEKRDRLLKLGKLLGLSPMDANRIIHVIVEHADQGIDPQQLTRQSFAQLEQAQAPVIRTVSGINWFTIVMTTVLLLLLEFAILFSVFPR
ncbi:MAG: hypothetical protein JKX85_13275 [Phycisphaeraceae bacterium]|nr:hypothetical protein [Phycisphaeraceae bacterium]